MYNILLIEDEKLGIETFSSCLIEVSITLDFMVDFYFTTNTIEAEEIMESVPFDFIFADIRLNGDDNLIFKLLHSKAFKQQQANLIFLSAFYEEKLNSDLTNYEKIIELPHLNYKLFRKPISISKLKDYFSQYIKKLTFVDSEKQVFLKINKELDILIAPSEICWFSKHEENTLIFTLRQKEPYEAKNVTLKSIFDKVKTINFVQIHTSHIINIQHLRKFNPMFPRDINKKDFYVYMERLIDKDRVENELELGRSFKKSFEKKIGK